MTTFQTLQSPEQALSRAATSSAPHREPVSGAQTAGLRILIVEDHADCAEGLQLLLARRGHHVRVARDAMAALDIVSGFEPDIAFVDVGLPDIDGYELAAAMRRDPVGEHCMLVALSAYVQPQARRSASRTFAHYLVKPVDIAVIDGLIATVTQAPHALLR